MDKGRTEQIIEKLIDSVENGQSVPFGAGKVAVNKDETIMMLRELESIVNGELKIYREFNDRKGKIINDAKKEAEEIIYEAEQTASRIRVTKRMSTIGTAFKAESLDREERQALRTAHDTYAASLIYTDEMLTEVNDVVAQAYDLVANQYGIMINTLQEKAELIAKNKAELMGSLKELSKEDRYTQILELGQLLSHELYYERMKARAMEEDGSYQMEMMFEEQVAATEQNSITNQQMQYNQDQMGGQMPVDASFVSEQPVVQADTAYVSEQPVVQADTAFVSEQPMVQADTAFVSEQPMVQADTAFISEQPVVQADTAFVSEQPIVQADTAFVSEQPVVQADTASVSGQPVVQADTAFVSEQPVVQADTAIVNEQPVVKNSTFNNVQINQGYSATTKEKHIPDEEHSIEAVSKTLELFKNYRPGGNKK